MIDLKIGTWWVGASGGWVGSGGWVALGDHSIPIAASRSQHPDHSIPITASRSQHPDWRIPTVLRWILFALVGIASPIYIPTPTIVLFAWALYGVEYILSRLTMVKLERLVRQVSPDYTLP